MNSEMAYSDEVGSLTLVIIKISVFGLDLIKDPISTMHRIFETLTSF